MREFYVPDLIRDDAAGLDAEPLPVHAFCVDFGRCDVRPAVLGEQLMRGGATLGRQCRAQLPETVSGFRHAGPSAPIPEPVSEALLDECLPARVANEMEAASRRLVDDAEQIVGKLDGDSGGGGEGGGHCAISPLSAAT